MLQTIRHLLIRPRCFRSERESPGGVRTHLTETPWQGTQLNPVENVWQYLRENWLSNHVFDSYEAILDAGCNAWNKLVDKPNAITSIGMRKWAHENIGQ